MDLFLVGFLIATIIGGGLAYRCYETRSSLIKRSNNQQAKLTRELENLKSSSEYEIESLKGEVEELKAKGKELKQKVETLEEEKARLATELHELKSE